MTGVWLASQSMFKCLPVSAYFEILWNRVTGNISTKPSISIANVSMAIWLRVRVIVYSSDLLSYTEDSPRVPQKYQGWLSDQCKSDYLAIFVVWFRPPKPINQVT